MCILLIIELTKNKKIGCFYRKMVSARNSLSVLEWIALVAIGLIYLDLEYWLRKRCGMINSC